MRGKIAFVLILAIVLGAQNVFAQYKLPEPVFSEAAPAAALIAPNQADFTAAPFYLWNMDPAALPEPLVFMPFAMLAAAADTDAAEPFVPQSLRNNRFYLESQRLTLLAQSSYDSGDYDASSEYAKEAVHYAELSDEFVALQLKIKDANDSIAAAAKRLSWADTSGASKQYAAEYAEAQGYYSASIDARGGEDWDGAIDNANKVINMLAYIQAPDDRALPAQYTVRAWAVSRDCLWNIAGRAWAYNDPFQWKAIFDANKAKFPEADNPDLIHPGMVLDIPSIKGETRQGMWDANKNYDPLKQ